MQTKLIAAAALGALLSVTAACGSAIPTAPQQVRRNSGGIAGGGMAPRYDNGGMAGSGGYTAPPPPNGGMAGSGG